MILLFIVKYMAFFLGCFFCFLLHAKLDVPIVIASSVVGLIGSFIPLPSFIKERYHTHPHAAIYAGSFAGMCSAELITSYWELGIISMIGALIYILTMNLFHGFGGKLGSVAFVSVTLFILVRGVFW